MSADLNQLVQRIADSLRRNCYRVVFAESCTAGLVSALLARVPGVSEFHCGSAVVYRLDTKTRWLGIPAEMLLDPGPVSDPVARGMAEGVLERTPEADISVAITGHLGPGAPVEQDGLVYIGMAMRDAETPARFRVSTTPHRLGNPAENGESSVDSLRVRRQFAAARLALESLLETLELGGISEG